MSATLLCLALTVFYEARGEPTIGQVAVAQVVMNRAKEKGVDACDVVTAKGQFTWGVKKTIKKKTVDGETQYVVDETKLPVHRKGWSKAVRVAEAAMTSTDNMRGIKYFHATYVKPPWADTQLRVFKIGNHIFYADPVAYKRRV